MNLATKALIADGFARLSLQSSFTALMILTFQSASASIDLGIISVSLLLPSLVLTVSAGRIMERFPPRQVFLAATLLRAIVLLLLPLVGAKLLLLALAAGLIGLLQQVLAAAKLTFDATVVAAPERTRFNSKRALLSGLAVLLGPSLAGVIGGFCGGAAAVLLSSALGLFSFLPLCRGSHQQPLAGCSPEECTQERAEREGLGAMLRWLWRSEQLGILVLAYIVLVAILEMESPLIFPFVKDVYGSGPSVSGTLLGVCGLGALAGALLMHRRNTPMPGWVLTSLLVVDGILLALIAQGPDIRLLYVLFSLLGILATITQVTVETQVQERAPRRYHPLLFSSMAFAGGAGGASLALGATALADVTGPARVLTCCAGLEIAVGLLATVLIVLAALATPRPSCAKASSNG